MQYTPPHSPDYHQKGVGAQFQFHGHGTYPKGLGLDHQREHYQYPKGPGPESDPTTQMNTFAKRPISPPLSSGELSDSSNSHLHHAEHPVSLLSALMHSPRSTSGPTTPGTGLLSPHSSVPSTAVSSPHLRPTSSAHSHGGLDVPAMSILRRDSVSSDGEALHLKEGQGLSQAQIQEVRPDVVKRASSLKFAVAPPLKRRSPSVNPHTHMDQAVAVPKFDTPSPRAHPDQDQEEGDKSHMSVEIEEDDVEDRDDNEAEDGESEGSDLGYQEDSESSDEDIDGSPRYRQGPKSKYPFARSTNYRRRRHAPESEGQRDRSPSPPPAPAVLPPPTRRGRGHIRVDESCISGKETEGGCSRHRSPPPSRSRSHSRSGDQKMERVGRLSDAGPREGRAGSPMPSRSKLLAASEDEEEQEQELEESPVDKKDVFGSWNGWKSDDASFYGPSSLVKGIRTVSAPPPHEQGSAIADEDAGDNGVRSFFRRASEHIPAFRKSDPSMAYPQPQPLSTGQRALSPHNTSPCPPALDETPALANSIARVEMDYSGGLAHRLEQSLSTSYRSEAEVRVQV